jgi:hypothetical protein
MAEHKCEWTWMHDEHGLSVYIWCTICGKCVTWEQLIADFELGRAVRKIAYDHCLYRFDDGNRWAVVQPEYYLDLPQRAVKLSPEAALDAAEEQADALP